MITHDQLAYAIERSYPGLKHATDFLIAHPLDTAGNQAGLPFIMRWSAPTIPQPNIADMISAFGAVAADFEANLVRDKREGLLKLCDWTQMADVPAETSSAWQVYRQALRDITDQPGFPFNVTWPNEPA